MKNTLSKLVGVLLGAALIAGCAKEQVTPPPLPFAETFTIGSEANPIGTFAFKHYNESLFQGPLTVAVRYDKLPFSTHFELCDLGEDKCKSSLVLKKETGSNRVMATFDINLISGYDNEGTPVKVSQKISNLPIVPGSMQFLNSKKAMQSTAITKNEVGIFDIYPTVK